MSSSELVSLVGAERDVSRQLLALCPWLEDVDGGAVDRYVRAEVRARKLASYVEMVMEERGIEAVKPYLWSELAKAEQNAQKFGQDLGLDPTGRARVLKDLGWAKTLARNGVEVLRERGRALRRGGGELEA